MYEELFVAKRVNNREIAEEFCEYGVEYAEEDQTCFVVCVDEDEAHSLARLLEGVVHVKHVYETDWAIVSDVL
jgi:K+/H+ antiporter YhaU regulatory subunit KhtT